MGNRLSKIVTRTGDAGMTGLANGERVSKDCLRIDCIGEIDELNSCLGVLLAEELPAAVREVLTVIQHELFNLGGEICLPGYSAIQEAHILHLEEQVEKFNGELAPLKEFILPGGTRAAALSHLCRTVCRRAERQIVQLGNSENVGDWTRKYLNRLSDLLFVLGRMLNKRAGHGDVLWAHKKARTIG